MELTIEQYEPSQASRWDSFVLNESVNGTIFHTRRFLSYHPPDRFKDASIMVWNQSGDLAAVVPACETEDGYFSHQGSSYGGPVIHPAFYRMKRLHELLDAIIDHFERRLSMRLAPSIFSERRNDPIVYLLGRNHGVIRELSVFRDLKASDADFITQVPRSSARKSVRSLFRDGFSVHAADDDDAYKAFHQILEANLQEHGTKPTHSLDEMLELRSRLGSDEILLWGGNADGQMSAGVWLMRANQRAWHAFYIAKDYEHGEQAAVPCVLVEAMTMARSHGAAYLNFGICTEDQGRRMNIGLFDFKESLGGETINRYLILPTRD